MFEIGRTQAIDISQPDPTNLQPPRKDWEAWGLLMWQLAFVTGLLCCGGLFVIFLFYSGRDRTAIRPQKLFVYTLPAAILSAGLAFTIVCALARWAGTTGEPIYLTEGVSIWPTETIRIFAGLLAVHFLLVSIASVRANRKSVEEGFDLDSSAAHGRNPRVRLKPWARLAQINDGGRTPEINHLWEQYVALGKPLPRVRRVGALVACYALFSLFALFLFGFPHVPARNESGRLADHVIFTLAVLVVGVLAIYAGDVASVFEQVVRNLGSGTSRWPAALVNRVRTRKKIPEAAASLWLDIRFIAARSKAVASLALYPSFVLVLMLLARSSYFADWDWPVSVPLIAGLGLLFTASCHFLLLHAAAHARKEALGRLHVLAEDAPDETARQAIVKLSQEITAIKEGAFASLLQFPAMSAVALPLLAGLLEYLSGMRG